MNYTPNSDSPETIARQIIATGADSLMAITGILGVGAPEGTPIGWVAHIGGFLAGIALGFAFRPRLPSI